MSLSTNSQWGNVHPQNISFRQKMALPPYLVLRSIELQGFSCNEFVEHFGFIQFLALDATLLVRCVSSMTLLRILLPFEGRVDDDSFWPLLRIIRLNHLGAAV